MADASTKPLPPPVAEWLENKRFIRTFESDAAAIKGGTPELASRKVVQMPVLKAPEDALTRAVATSTDSDVMDLDSVPAFDPARVGAIPESPTTSPAERLVGGSSLTDIPPLPVPIPPLPPPAPTFQPPPESLAPIHTYTSDFDTAVQSQHASNATILAAEQDKRKDLKSLLPVQKSVNRIFVIGAAVLVVLAAIGIYAAYYYTSAPQTVSVTPPTSVRIFVDERAQVAGTGTNMEQAIEKSVAAPLASGAVRLLTLASGSTTEGVFSALNPPAPAILMRNITANGSIAGVINVNGTQSPFFILAVESYSDTFSGMLSWEPDMAANLAGLFPPYPTDASSTTPVTAPIFSDEVVANHNVRAYKDAAGQTVVLYGYWDQNTLIIARDEDAFAAIVGRLANSRTTE